MASIGSWALIVSLIVSCYGVLAAVIARRRKSPMLADSAEKTLWIVAGLATAACGILLYALLAHEFQIKYVYGHTSTQLPIIYRISALWAGEQGSLLLWFWFVSVLAWVALLFRPRTDPARSYLVCILSLANAFFAALILLTSNPFDIYPMIPSEGAGMLPLLRHPGMVLHPPILFLGYAAYTIPFASALAALWSNSLNTDWLDRTRRWSLFAWATLGAGILIGAWWAYVELGWGGFWAWDPVENASLIPWLVGTAFLHSTIVEERVGKQRRWNLMLPAMTFALCLFATLVTRGGIIISDLHGFSSSIQPIAYYLFAAIIVSLLAMLALTIRRQHSFSDLASSPEGLISREKGFLLTNVIFCGIAAIVFIGTVYPSLVRAISGNLVSLGASFFNRVASPFMLVVIVLIGICPWLVWGRTPGKMARRLVLPVVAGVLAIVLLVVFGIRSPASLIASFVCAFVAVSLFAVALSDLATAGRGKRVVARIVAMAGQLRRSHRRYGTHLVHFAMVLIVIGVSGAMLHKSEQLVSLMPGESVLFEKYTITYEGFGVDTIDQFPETYESHNRYETALSVARGGAAPFILRPEKNYHWVLDSPWVTEVAISSTLFEDLYVVLASLSENGRASFELVLNPLISWLWIGGALLLVGAVLAAWPTRRRTKEGVADA